YRVKGPTLFARANVERADVSRRGGQCLASQSADDQHVFVNGAGGGVADRDLPGVAPDNTFAQIDASLLAEARRRLSGFRVERIEPMPKPEEYSLISAVFPIHHASVAHLAQRPPALVRVEAPDQFPVPGVERDHAQLRRGRVHYAVNDDRIALHLGAGKLIARIEPPGDFELMDVVAGDLIQRRIVNILRPAAEHPPFAVLQVE